MHSFNGMPIMESLLLTVRHEDWSGVRSPSRARRRIKQGHKQRIKYVDLPSPDLIVTHGIIHGHPETIRKMFEAINAKEAANAL